MSYNSMQAWLVIPAKAGIQNTIGRGLDYSDQVRGSLASPE